MAIVRTNDQHYADIASAIRSRSGGTEAYRPEEMPDAILELGPGDRNSEIIVYAPTGSAVTLTYADTVRTVEENDGVWRFRNCALGNWRVDASKDSKASVYFVNIEEQGQLMRYEVYVEYMRVYGVVRDITSTSPAWARTNDAMGMTATASVGTVAGHSDFDEAYPWRDIRRETFSTGDVMVRIPKFWYQRYREGNLEYLKIADTAADGFTLHPAFNHSGAEQEEIYVGAYVTSENNLSQSGHTPRTGQTLGNYRSLATGKGEGWGMLDISTLSAIQMLCLVEYATYDSQSAVGAGYCNLTSSDPKQATGGTDTVPKLTGVPSGDIGKVDVVYRGIEGIWGNIYQMIDGIIANTSEQKYYVCNQPGDYGQAASSAYTCLSYSLPVKQTSNQFITRMGLDGNGMEHLMLASQASSGSGSTYICDIISASNTTGVCMRHGGRWYENQKVGLFLADFTLSSGTSQSQTGYRLLYIPKEVRA